jgi:hypothetical protein
VTATDAAGTDVHSAVDELWGAFRLAADRWVAATVATELHLDIDEAGGRPSPTGTVAARVAAGEPLSWDADADNEHRSVEPCTVADLLSSWSDHHPGGPPTSRFDELCDTVAATITVDRAADGGGAAALLDELELSQVPVELTRRYMHRYGSRPLVLDDVTQRRVRRRR